MFPLKTSRDPSEECRERTGHEVRHLRSVEPKTESRGRGGESLKRPDEEPSQGDSVPDL